MTDPSERLGCAHASASSETPIGAGFAAAGVVSLAAGVCESVARTEGAQRPEAAGFAVQADRLRTRAREAGVANRESYDRARRSLRPPDDLRSGRDGAIRAALFLAADTLLAIAEAAADCACLAGEMAGSAGYDLQPDLAAAAELAAGAAESVTILVEVNLALTPDDPRRLQAQSALAAARSAAARARCELPA